MVFVSSCVTVYDTINNRNLALEYHPGDLPLHPEFELYSPAAKDLRLYFRLYPKEFAFGITKTDTIPHAQVSVFYRITKDYSSIEILDSLTRRIKLRNRKQAMFMSYMPVHLKEDGSYVMEVFITDKFARNTISKVIPFDFKNQGMSSNFMMVTKHGNPWFYPYLSLTDTLYLRSDLLGNQPLKVTHFKADTSLPAEPGNVFKPEPKLPVIDSTWIIERSDTNLLVFQQPGLLYFTDTSESFGRNYLNGQPFYPYVKTASELLKPLSYIATKNEMKKLLQLESPKVAIDSFWLKTAEGEYNQARELIRVFYNRVQLANYFFSDYKEGYLTDRGMMYTVCGAPDHVRKTDEGEYWTYGKNEKDALEFYFYKKQVSQIGTSYYLKRSETYARVWHTAVRAWRNGQVFSLNP